MKISPKNPFKVVYSLYRHEYLGFLFESFIVELDKEGRLSLKHQNISHYSAEEFSSGLEEIDFELISLMDLIQQEMVIKKFAEKRIPPLEFFPKVFHPEKGNKELQAELRVYLEGKRAAILERIPGKSVFEMGRDGEPTARELNVPKIGASILFHIWKNDENTHYYPTIKFNGEKLEFRQRGARILCNSPAWMLFENTIYHFNDDVDGKKLRPFINKKFISIPEKLEGEYFEKFVAPLIASFDVVAHGVEVKTENRVPRSILRITDFAENTGTLFLGNGNSQPQEKEKFLLEMVFKYGQFLIPGTEDPSKRVKVFKNNGDFLFNKIQRDYDLESRMEVKVRKLGLDIKGFKALIDKSEFQSWLMENLGKLEDYGIEIVQDQALKKKYYLGQSQIDLNIKESEDWFDLKARVRFGEFEIKFTDLSPFILNGISEFPLPNGEIALIPKEWFTQYSDLFTFSEEGVGGQDLKLRKYHLGLVSDLKSGNLAAVTMDRRLEKLINQDLNLKYDFPKKFIGKLRPYQEAGYNWLRFLMENKLGGCLADDMGLGKTVQTLALLQYLKENNIGNTTLMVMPTSLVYNWLREAEKFTPDIQILNYTGTNRNKDSEQFNNYDVVVTSYGTARIDIDILKSFPFFYAILDEAQAIKNPGSNIFQSINQLNTKQKLTLTGTPLENTSMDIWSQMSFVNPGFLGSEIFFRKNFQIPIEKKGDEVKTKKLNALIKPFILRRTKEQVAKDLPSKIENVKYCVMTPEQESIYEEVKSVIRNRFLEAKESKMKGQLQILLLQGLSQLRQLANHPKMVDEGFDGDSGKMKTLSHMIKSALLEGHKILIFSQFVKHLKIVRAFLDNEEVLYSYLDGGTKNRMGQVELFQGNDSIKVFLISLKAGGTGLNLTAADYVFLLDPWWNPAVEAQAIDRAHRIGQRENVFIYRFITKGTVEEKILKLQEKKKGIADALIKTEENFFKALSKEDIENLFE
jgi:SNF2 family DNA or RNA helicase